MDDFNARHYITNIVTAFFRAQFLHPLRPPGALAHQQIMVRLWYESPVTHGIRLLVITSPATELFLSDSNAEFDVCLTVNWPKIYAY